jgi:hypothetical protein
VTVARRAAGPLVRRAPTPWTTAPPTWERAFELGIPTQGWDLRRIRAPLAAAAPLCALRGRSAIRALAMEEGIVKFSNTQDLRRGVPREVGRTPRPSRKAFYCVSKIQAREFKLQLGTGAGSSVLLSLFGHSAHIGCVHWFGCIDSGLSHATRALAESQRCHRAYTGTGSKRGATLWCCDSGNWRSLRNIRTGHRGLRLGIRL